MDYNEIDKMLIESGMEYLNDYYDDRMVNHPDHYQSESGIEVIDVIKAFTESLNGVEAFDTGNVIKYICRWDSKGGVQDLKKAAWYLDHLIKHVEKEEKETEL